MVSSGILLQLKKQSNWIQPNIEITSSSKPVMLQSYLDAAISVKEANILSWDDIDRIDIRPDKGIAKIKSKNNWEIQIDIETSEYTQVILEGLISSKQFMMDHFLVKL